MPITTKGLVAPIRDLLQDLRHAWSLPTTTGQPSLRHYPLRRPGEDRP